MSKMIKTMTVNEVMGIMNILFPAWESRKGEIKIKGKPMFALVGIKKSLEKHAQASQEAFSAIAEQFGGIFNSQMGGYQIPEENQKEAQAAIAEIAKQEVEITYLPIILTGDEDVPVEIIDAIYDFVEIAE